jgi:ATPase subunit of ABC transporter with duplicated ATPase domains
MGRSSRTKAASPGAYTTSQAYFPSDNAAYFDGVNLSLIDWLRQFSEDKHEVTVRGWLGRMLFSGEEALKEARVLSGGERVRCILAKMMVSGANVLVMDEPTNHLDLEAITALNEGLVDFKGTMLFTSRDHQVMQTVANRVIEILPGALIDRRESYDEYLDYLETRA